MMRVNSEVTYVVERGDLYLVIPHENGLRNLLVSIYSDNDKYITSAKRWEMLMRLQDEEPKYTHDRGDTPRLIWGPGEDYVGMYVEAYPTSDVIEALTGEDLGPGVYHLTSSSAVQVAGER
jgi:hypothetical protein